MSLVATLKALAAAGGTADQLIAVVEAHEAGREAKAAERRVKDAARQKAKRVRNGHAESRGVTRSHAESRGPSPRAEARTQVDNPSSSLRSEDTQEANASFVDTPIEKPGSAVTPAVPEKPKTKPPKSVKGTRLPEDWEPSSDEFELGRDAGLTDEEIHRAALEFRNYWCSRSRDATKVNWRLTWHNRVNELGERKQRVGARLALVSNQPRGRGRGASSFADIYARRHGYGEG